MTDFLHSLKAIKKTLQYGEVQVLDALLELGAKPVNAIRAQVIKNLALQNKDAIIAKYGIIDSRTPIQRSGPVYVRPEVKIAMERAQEFHQNVKNSFIEDSDLLRAGLTPLSATQKTELWILAMQGIIDVPSVLRVEEILGFLESQKLIDKRALEPGSRAKEVWFVLEAAKL